MPINREPHVYQGYVISRIGISAGKPVTMDFKNAQNCVQSGTHDWADDEKLQPMGLTAEIDARADALAAEREADRKHNELVKQVEVYREKIVTLTIHVEDGKTFLANAEWPEFVAFPTEVIDNPASPITREDDTIVISLANGMAKYRIALVADGVEYGELVESIAPDAQTEEVQQSAVDIPDDWRELHHLQIIALAKKVAGTDGKMTKAEAIAILEERTKADDQVRTQEPAEAQGEKGTDAVKGFRDKDGNPTTPEARAQEAAIEGIDDFGEV